MTAVSLEAVAWLAWLVYWRIAARDVLVHEWRESKLSVLLYRVPLGTAAILLCISKVWLGYLQIPLLPFGELYAWSGALITLAGLGFALWARIHLKGNWSASIELKRSHQLVRTGPYQITRHPIYAGLLAAVLGTSITLGDIRGLLAFILVWIAFFIKARREDALLRKRFGDEYETYRRGLKPWISLGTLLVVALGVLKVVWPGGGGVVFDNPDAESNMEIIDQDASASDVPTISWKRSLPIEPMSSAVSAIGGTELRALAAMDGTLYAGNGYWRDTRKSEPSLPGPQIFALDSPTDTWRVDTQFDERISKGWQKGERRYEAIGSLYSVQFHSDSQGRPLQPARSVLLASVWDRLGSLRVFYKNGANGKWSHSDLVADAPLLSQIRSFGFHRDTVTGIEHVFAGTNPEGIVSGVYDASGAGGIQWSRSPEPGVIPWRRAQRVMSFAECNGKLYATVGWQIYEREDGYKPRWKPVFTFGRWGRWMPLNGYGGLRGLTSVADPSGAAQDLLVVAEGRRGGIIRISPSSGFKAVNELDVRSALSRLWNIQVGGDIVAYNDMTAYPDLLNNNHSCPNLLMGGFDAQTPNIVNGIGARRKAPGAYLLIRNCEGNYTSREIVDPTITPKPALVATRTLILSPFPSDPPGTLYAGGFDAGNIRPHNSAWLYRGTPALSNTEGLSGKASPQK